ncbi:Diphthine--ammonia ligase [Geodia barretti]|uniref:Diphthine--ammonia ligase n=1 Tax=Geodia barretti TaxID=519541 RepID=A0AA35S8T3_GEOBA|nr:Diphthine--ammonia ligase [Geodia barretti]
MRVVALISGGKDSCYSAMQCVAAGHTLVALANLQPEGKEEELDSYMFQTVGHEAVELVAHAMGLPLYRATTSGRSKGRGLQYRQQEGDEVEDLFGLLQGVQRLEKVEGVASGAVLSDYQRLRVEHVCQRLGLTSLALLWRREQSELLEEMILSGVSAVLVKVACIGLKASHLGRSLQEMKPHLSKLARQYGVNVCGEGGEYETLTLDCPLFSHSIVIEEKEVVEVTADELAPVAHLQLKKLRLQPKSPSTAQTFPPPPPLLPLLPHSQVSPYEVSADSVATVSDSVRGEEWRVWRWAGFDGRGEDVSQQTSHVLTQLSSWLEERGAMSRDVALSHLFLSSMEDFPLVNSLYKQFFPSSPPARVCVQVSLPQGVLLRLETLLYQPERGEEGDAERGLVEMHVQSVSGWAPANIGPYSQAVRVSDKMSGCGPVIAFVRVPGLPRGACVEWSFTALSSPHSPLHRPESPRVGLCDAGKVCVRELSQRLTPLGLSERRLTTLRWFLPHFSSTPTHSSAELFGLTLACPSVAATICEGYFGQNCSLSLLARPPPFLTDPNRTPSPFSHIIVSTCCEMKCEMCNFCMPLIECQIYS